MHLCPTHPYLSILSHVIYRKIQSTQSYSNSFLIEGIRINMWRPRELELQEMMDRPSCSFGFFPTAQYMIALTPSLGSFLPPAQFITNHQVFEPVSDLRGLKATWANISPRL